MIDLNRENIAEFDVREFYVQLVNMLKVHGYQSGDTIVALEVKIMI